MRPFPVFLVCALSLAACVEKPATPAPAPVAKKTQAKPEPKMDPDFRKPVRMNGRGKVTSISLEQFFELQQSGKALIFDARPGFFYKLGHIPGAINLPVHGRNVDVAIHARETEIASAIKSGKTIVTYCTSTTCPDARALARRISGFGYPASIFTGGWDEWKEAGMPTE